MLFKIAWRNLWRNKRRSVIILTSIVVGVAALIVSDFIMRGMAYQMLRNQIGLDVSHIQIHSRGWHDNKVLKNYMKNTGRVEELLKKKPFIQNFSKRIVSQGMINSAAASSGVTINGVEHDREAKITRIAQDVTQGTYLTGKEQEIVIGREMADKLEVELGSKIVLMAAGTEGSVNSQLFRVKGIFETVSSAFEKMKVYINIEDARKLLNLEHGSHVFAMITAESENTISYADSLQASLDENYEVMPYEKMLPLLVTYLEVFESSMIVFYVIIILAVLFGVINAMLMAVMERMYEFGVLMSIGMKNLKLFIMVELEAFSLGLLGSLGGAAGGLIIFFFMKDGIDLSVYSESLSSYNVGNIIYPVLEPMILVESLFLMTLASMLAAVYPALKAVRLQPTEAMRKV